MLRHLQSAPLCYVSLDQWSRQTAYALVEVNAQICPLKALCTDTPPNLSKFQLILKSATDMVWGFFNIHKRPTEIRDDWALYLALRRVFALHFTTVLFALQVDRIKHPIFYSLTNATPTSYFSRAHI